MSENDIPMHEAADRDQAEHYAREELRAQAQGYRQETGRGTRPYDAPASLLDSDDFQTFGSPVQFAGFLRALASARGQFQPIEKNREVTIVGKNKNGERIEYTYSYAEMGTILDATVPALSGDAIAHMMPPARVDATGLCSIRLILGHENGGGIVTIFRFEFGGDIKDYGGRLSYAQRYLYSKTLNLSTDSDSDEQPTRDNETSATGRDRGKQRTPPPPPSAPKPAPAPQAAKPAPAPAAAPASVPPPASVPTAASSQAAQEGPEDAAQRTAIIADVAKLAIGLGWNRAALRDRLKEWFSVDSSAELDIARLGQYRDRLAALPPTVVS